MNESEDSKGIVQIVGLHDFLCLDGKKVGILVEIRYI